MVPTAGAPLRLDTSTRALTISPDGTRVVYLGNPGTLVVRALDQLESQTINGVGAASHPFFSPDGQWIAFFDGNTVKKVAAAGGPIQLIARLNSTPSGGSWGPNNVIVLSVAGEEGTGLVQVSAAGGVPEMLTTPDRAAGESYHHWPEILPGGQAVLFALIGGPGVGGTAVLDLKTRKWRRVLDLGRISAQYVEPGYLIYVFAGTVFAARFDVKRLEVTSAEVPVGVDHVADVAIGAHVSIARDGTLIYVPQPPPLSLTWVDRQNRREPLGAPPGPYQGVRLSPDATRAVLATREGSDLLVWDLQRRSFTRLTKEGGFDLNPTWTPDGTRLVWTSGRASRGGLDLFAQSADGTGPVKQLTESNNAQLALDITPDGRQLLVGLTGPRTSLDMALLPLDPTGTLTTRLATPTTLLATPFDERLGKVSPDGRWLAYDSNENGAFEVFVRPFPDVNTAKWQVSTGGGSQPLWARSGRELFYRGLDGSVVSVSIQPEGNQLRRGIPATVIAGSSFLNETMSLLPQQTYDVMTDGSRFLMIQEGTSSSIASGPVIVVVQNLLNELAVRLSPN
jgi:serine/threonine-protein kinase